MATRIGDLLIQENLLTQEQLNVALKHQRDNGGRLGSILIQLGYVDDDDITALLSRKYGVPSINLTYFEIDPSVIKLIPMEVAQKYMVIPLSRVGNTLTVASTDPTNVFAMDDIKFMTGFNVEPVVATEASVLEALEKYYGTAHSIELKKVYEAIAQGDQDGLELNLDAGGDEEEVSIDQLQRSSEDAPIIKLVNLILSESIKRGASDIHIEPYEKDFRVRFRIDGILYNMMNPPLKLRDAITSRVKIMAKMDISEKRLPQDGRIKIRTSSGGRKKEIDYRVSSLPTLFGEKIVLRILDKDVLPLDMSILGFEQCSLQKIEAAIAKPYGMVLVTGPTGSGKTSTLYAALNRLNTPETNIMTAEDPVEYNFKGINQVQIREQIGLTFAAALRSFLRQDPNIILVGEIRDFETTEIAIKAALTGHLVLSSIHTNDAPSTISRLLNMGIEPFLVATSVHLICAQRLIRKICPDCRTEVKTPVPALIKAGFSAEEAETLQTFKGEGCKTCNDTGYKGRVGMYEVMEISEAIQELILVGASAREIRHKAVEEGMLTLRQSGLEKIRAGMTTLDEVLRETVEI
ncbi:MAG: type IV-A pilus assembly ATPase PilB [Acidobacteriota bacterium]|jgi:type IV pilus assembly protein PilB|nr:type IV-A pilus assembly ATPase PilB [Acidobacteriota bacterium]NLT34035.1 type IV-A pilus assembly ATPase PilB [Acidobacteriota bacterium]